MIRILYVARYHDATMERKIALMAAQPDLSIWLVRPSVWRDEYGEIAVETITRGYHVFPVPLIGRANDPHRALYRTLTFAMRAVRPDIIHAEEEPDSLAALQIALARRLFAPQSRLILHTWQNVNRRKRWFVWWVTRACLSQAAAVLCANHEAVKVLREMEYTGAAAVIPPQGVDTQVFRPHPRPLRSDTFTLAYVGRFVPEKGVDLLIEALDRVGPQARLLLVGEGSCKPALEEQARASGAADRIAFVAPMPPDRLAQFLGQVDVLILPSRSRPVWKEQFGRVLVEAMACKVPVIGSDSGAILEVVGDAGLIFPEGDVGALADCLNRLIESPELRADLAERGCERAARLYSQERVAEQTAEFYRQAAT